MIHAFCNVALAPIRAENSDKSEMISQILFGEGLEILEIKADWSYIKCVYDNYEGWVDSKQYKITKNLVSADFLSFHLSHACQFDSLSFPLVLGSRLPNFDGINFTIEKEKYIYNGKAIDSKKNAISNLQKLALKYINAPYLWGGRSPYGIDCSGYTQMVFSFFNIVLPRDAYLQANLGETINFVGEARVADLAFFGKEEKITHVGICLGNNEIIHASGKVRMDILDHIGIYNKELKKYTHFIKTIKRLI
jgi:hypothetical protein